MTSAHPIYFFLKSNNLTQNNASFAFNHFLFTYALQTTKQYQFLWTAQILI